MTESETIEFKKSLSELKEGLISLVAMLNKHGYAELWFGIRNDGTPVGMEISEKTLRDVAQSIGNHVEPKLYPEITKESLKGKACLKVTASGGARLYYAYGRAYMRVSDADRQLSADELERLILERNRSYQSWDTDTSTLGMNKLYKGGIQAFVEKAGLPWTTPQAALDNLGLVQNGKVLNAATVFFATKPVCELRTAVFAGSSSATLLDQQSFKGGILELIEEAQRYILKNIHIGMQVKGLERIDIPEIDLEAIREAVINAFCHRDYRDPDPVQIAIYQDRVEIRNPGTLIEGMQLEDLKKGTISRRRNPRIADLLRRVKLVESWGRGIPLILEKAPNTTFVLKAGLFVSTLQRSIPPSEKGSEKKGSSRLGEKLGEKLGENRRRILEAMETDPSVSAAQLSQLLSISQTAVENNINYLKRSGYIQRIGPAKGGHWEILIP